jgi:hypothetical protein
MARDRFQTPDRLLSVGLLFFATCLGANGEPAALARLTVTPKEMPGAVLHNPDMGWVLYENYPVDQDPHGSSTLLSLPNDNFTGVDAVGIMFSWQDVEKRPDEYDFSKVDFAYDYWAARGKAIQLRLSSESLLWWNNRNPPAGRGVPDYVLENLSTNEKQVRELSGIKYTVVDARNPYYRDRLAKFLCAIGDHFSNKRPVTLIDLRGNGVWGEWHTGFQYASLDEGRDALKGVIDVWSSSLPKHRLALSYSYDPDGPKVLYEGTTEEYDVKATSHYAEYLSHSAFDYALTKPNLCYRRDGCGGAVHSNERKLNEEAFQRGRGPMFSEFVDGYAQSKVGGDEWLEWKINDALSLHPNYISLLGWQGADSLAFMKERRDLFDSALIRMGYRLVPTRIVYPTSIVAGAPFKIEMRWVNRGVGRALRDYTLRFSLLGTDGKVVGQASAEQIRSSDWVAGHDYDIDVSTEFKNIKLRNYRLAFSLYDDQTGRTIELPIEGAAAGGRYRVGDINVTADKLRHACRAACSWEVVCFGFFCLVHMTEAGSNAVR